MASGVSSSSLAELWASMASQNGAEVDPAENSSSNSVGSLLSSSVQTVNWVLENRGGLAWLTGLVMVPSQFLGPKADRANQTISEASRSANFNLERFSVSVEGTETSVEGAIYYPRGWAQSDRSSCMFYSNPNGITVSEYFVDGAPRHALAELLQLSKCPIIMYDYRGTGLSSENACMSSIAFRPTYETVVVDGQAVLDYALGRFESVSVIGSSLGGGVATVSLERHLKVNPDDAGKVSLINHDSFSTTPKVIMPTWPRTANWAGRILGGLLDAETSMKSLVEREISIIVLCHDRDPVIPLGARMAEVVETLPSRQNVFVIHSPQYGHANFSHDMIRDLGRIAQGASIVGLHQDSAPVEALFSEESIPTSRSTGSERAAFRDVMCDLGPVISPLVIEVSLPK